MGGDTDWLIEQGLMDYSLFLAVRHVPVKQLPAEALDKRTSSGGMGEKPPSSQFAMLDGEEVVLVTIGIIDFLQPWTTAKKIAKCIKTLEFNKATIPPTPYGKRFKRHFAERLKADARLQALGNLAIKYADRV